VSIVEVGASVCSVMDLVSGSGNRLLQVSRVGSVCCDLEIWDDDDGPGKVYKRLLHAPHSLLDCPPTS